MESPFKGFAAWSDPIRSALRALNKRNNIVVDCFVSIYPRYEKLDE